MSRIPRYDRTVPRNFARTIAASRAIAARRAAAISGGGGGGGSAGALAYLWPELDGTYAATPTLNGTSQYYLSDGPVIPAGTASYTLLAWFYPTAAQTANVFDQRPIDGGTGETDGRIRYDAAGTVTGIYRTNGQAAITAATTNTATLNTWNLAALVVDTAADTVAISLNADFAGDATSAPGTASAVAGAGRVATMGAMRSAYPAIDYLAGRIGHVAVCSGALPEAAITAHYNSGVPLAAGSLTGAVQSALIAELDPAGPIFAERVAGTSRMRMFGLSTFSRPASWPGTSRTEAFQGGYLKTLGTFAAASAATAGRYQLGPSRIECDSVLSMSRSGATLLAGAGDISIAGHFPPPAAGDSDQDYYAELLADDSGIRVVGRAGGLVAVQLLDAGAVDSEVVSTDSIYGRAAITASSATNAAAIYPGPTTVDRTRHELTIGADACVRFDAGDRVRIVGDANYTGGHSLTRSDPVAGVVRFVTDGLGDPAVSTSSTFVESLGRLEQSNVDFPSDESGSIPRYVNLRIHHDGAGGIAIYARGEQIGSGTLAGLATLGTDGATTWLGTHSGSANDAPGGSITGFAAGNNLSAAAAAEVDARHTATMHRRVGYLDDHTQIRLSELAGVPRCSRAEEEVATIVLEPDGETLVGGGWAHPQTGTSYGFASGLFASRIFGSDSLAAAQDHEVYTTVCRRILDYDESAITPARTWSGSLGAARRLPIDAEWQTFFVDPAGGNDSNAGTEAAPFATMAPAIKRIGPKTRIRLKRGTTLASMGSGLTVTWLDFENATGVGALYGPIRFDAYGSGAKPILDFGGTLDTVRFTGTSTTRITFQGIDLAARSSLAWAGTLGTDFLIGDVAWTSYAEVSQFTPGGGQFVTVDGMSHSGASNGYLLYFGGTNHTDLAVTRHDPNAPVTNSEHVFRLQGLCHGEYSAVRDAVSMAGDASPRQFTLRFGLKDFVFADVASTIRQLQTTTSPTTGNGSIANVRCERVDIQTMTLTGAASWIVAHGYCDSTSSGPDRQNLSSPDHTIDPWRMRAFGVGTNDDAWTNFQEAPTAGAYANQVSGTADGNFGETVTVPAVALAELSGGLLTVQAAGYPLGGSDYRRLGWQYRVAGGDWTTIAGLAGRTGAAKVSSAAEVRAFVADDAGTVLEYGAAASVAIA